MSVVRSWFAALVVLVAAGGAAVGAVGCSSGDGGKPGAAATTASSCPKVEFEPAVFGRKPYQWRLSFSPTEPLAFWAESAGFFPRTRQANIVFSEQRDGKWGAPQDAPFPAGRADMDPYLTPDGKTLIFSSIRPVNGVERSDLDLWMVRRTGSGWSEPIHLGPEVNSPRDELYASVDSDGNLYVGSDRDATWDIWRFAAKPGGGWGSPARLGDGVNTASAWEFNPDISPDGRTLVFTVAGVIHVSHRTGTEFGPRRRLDDCVNSLGDQYHPTVHWPSKTLYYVQDGKFQRLPLPPEVATPPS